MNSDSEDLFLKLALKEVEEKLGWGPGRNWTTHDFAGLSEKIHETTGVALSITTLKRLWGKVNYKSKPTTATLNAIVKYVGYDNWQIFRQRKMPETMMISDERGVEPSNSKKGYHKHQLLMIASVAFFLVSAIFLVSFLFETSGNLAAREKESFVFTSKMMVSEGLPNSIIFNYDATAAEPTDTIQIQQSWDERLRATVPRDKKIHRSIYYHPGYFKAKLVINSEIVKEQDLYIKTKNWLPMVEQENVPVYFSAKDIFNEPGLMQLPIAALTAKNIPLQPEAPWVSYYNVRQFDSVASDNFTFETVVRNDYNEGAAVCQHTEIHVLLTGGAIIIPLSIKGCVAELRLFDLSGRREDTSVLGCKLSNWVNVRLQVRDGIGSLFINGQLAYDDLDFTLPPIEIIGLRYRFQGSGSVKSLALFGMQDKLIYEENFQ